MYVVTFYSFKGGSGRSMSLVNVAAALAQAGRSVLIVDFDLEAPGIGEFDLLKPDAPSRGVVEFVNDYLATGQVPNVSEYVYESNSFADTGGKILVMPAGVQDSSYQSRFSAINWQGLYDAHEGYVLMEDLRAQWDRTLHCDYVLIDSRTGYTDIGGICTRQLPDAVCLVFSPNRQNLAGLSHVVREIKDQKKISGLRHPRLHFAVSNVPVMDDENQLLAGALERFKEKLGYAAPCAIIHHYNSFALLNEEVFTLRYPKTLLSLEYSALAAQISEQNFGDRISVLEFLRSAIADYPGAGRNYTAADVELRIHKIVSNFGADPDVLYLVSRLKRISGDIEQSRELLEIAIERGCTLPRAFLDKAVFHDREQHPDAAWVDVKRALDSHSKASSTDIVLAIRIGLRLNIPDFDLSIFTMSNAVRSLSSEEILVVCSTVDDSRIGAALCVRLLSEVFDWDSAGEAATRDARIFLANSYIAISNLSKAVEIYSAMQDEELSIQLITTFNLGMALYWSGHTEDSTKYFAKCPALFSALGDDTPNVLQCEAFGDWILGRADHALVKLEKIESEISDLSPRRYFSCWRYYSATAREFSSDIREMKDMFRGIPKHPKFLLPFDEKMHRVR